MICAEEETATSLTGDEAVPEVHSLTPAERCELCQVALRTVYSHFSASVPSRRKLGHQLKHECKRHFNYRRRCLLAVKDATDMIFRDMTGGDFKPIRPCTVIKECKRLQSPITDEFYLEMNKTLAEMTMESSSLSPEISTTTTIVILPETVTPENDDPNPEPLSSSESETYTNPLSDALGLSLT